MVSRVKCHRGVTWDDAGKCSTVFSNRKVRVHLSESSFSRMVGIEVRLDWIEEQRILGKAELGNGMRLQLLNVKQ